MARIQQPGFLLTIFYYILFYNCLSLFNQNIYILDIINIMVGEGGEPRPPPNKKKEVNKMKMGIGKIYGKIKNMKKLFTEDATMRVALGALETYLDLSLEGHKIPMALLRTAFEDMEKWMVWEHPELKNDTWNLFDTLKRDYLGLMEEMGGE